MNLKSPGIKARNLSGKSPAPLQTVASTVRLHDPPPEALPPELPETPPHTSHITVSHVGDHSVFAPVLLGGLYTMILNSSICLSVAFLPFLFFLDSRNKNRCYFVA